MAVIYPKLTAYGTKNTLVLNPREALVYPFDIGDDWTRIRYGFVLSATQTGAVDYNGDMGGDAGPYSVAVEDAYSKYYLGLKRQGTGFATTDGDFFVGWSSSPDSPNTWMLNGTHWNRASFGVSYKNGVFSGLSTYSSSFTVGNNINPTGQSSFAQFFSFEITINDRGLPTQSLTFRGGNANGDMGTLTDTSKENLFNKMLTVSYVGNATQTGTVDFHTSNIPYELPNAFFFYTPQPNAQLKIHNLVVVKMN